MRQLRTCEFFYRVSNSCSTAFLILILVSAGSINAAAFGQCTIADLWASDGSVEDFYGWSVAISNDSNTLVIGANGYNTFAGAVYVIVRQESEWIEHSILTSPDPTPYSKFGGDVEISADGLTIVVGVPLDDTKDFFDSGSAFIFEFDDSSSTWVITAKLTASDNTGGLVLGGHLAMSADGNTIAISALGDHVDPDDSSSGAVYVFEKPDSGWVDMMEAAKLRSSDIEPQTKFGNSVAISPDGEFIVVGDNLDGNENGYNAGAAYIFERDKKTSKWIERQKIMASDGLFSDNFGMSVAVSHSGQTIIVGSKNDYPEGGDSTGAAYVFNLQGKVWVEHILLLASDAAGGHSFGWASEITDDGQTALISNTEGTTYLWQLSNGDWIEQAKLTSSDPNVGLLGLAIDMTSDAATAILGAKNSKVDGMYNFGSASVFDLLTPCLGDLDGNGMVSTSDLLILLANWGQCGDCKLPGNCPADLDSDCAVGTSDLLLLLSNWG